MQGVALNLLIFVAPALLCYSLVCTVAAKIKLNVLMRFVAMVQNSATGTRTRVARVRAEYPNQLDYSGSVCMFGGFLQHASSEHRPKMQWLQCWRAGHADENQSAQALSRERPTVCVFAYAVEQISERKTPTVGLEPTTTRLRALRSTD